MKEAQMRKEISKVYPNKKWKHKVEKMNTDQVLAIYYNFLAHNKFEEAEKKRQEIAKPSNKQLSFEDYIIGWDLSSQPDQ